MNKLYLGVENASHLHMPDSLPLLPFFYFIIIAEKIIIYVMLLEKKSWRSFFVSNSSSKQVRQKSPTPETSQHSNSYVMETGIKTHFRAVESMESSVGLVSRWCFPQIKDCASLFFWEMRTQKYAGKWKVLKMWMASEKRAIWLSLSATQMYNWTTSNCDFRWGGKLRNAEKKPSYGISNGKHFYEAWMKNWLNEE